MGSAPLKMSMFWTLLAVAVASLSVASATTCSNGTAGNFAINGTVHGVGMLSETRVMAYKHRSQDLYVFLVYESGYYKMTAVTVQDAVLSSAPASPTDRFIQTTDTLILGAANVSDMWDGTLPGYPTLYQVSGYYEVKDVVVTDNARYEINGTMYGAWISGTEHVTAWKHEREHLWIFVKQTPAQPLIDYKMTVVTLEAAIASSSPVSAVDRYVQSSVDFTLSTEIVTDMWDGTLSGHTTIPGDSGGTGYDVQDVVVRDLACERGGYKDICSGSCLLCPSGKYSWSFAAIADHTCLACPAGKTSTAGSTVVSNCSCPTGFSGPNGADGECVCSKGFTSYDGISCVPCAAGSFKPLEGWFSCTNCPSQTSSAMGSWSPANCTAACPSMTAASQIFKTTYGSPSAAHMSAYEETIKSFANESLQAKLHDVLARNCILKRSGNSSSYCWLSDVTQHCFELGTSKVCK